MAYALNEDYDLMLTTPARHALGLFRDHTGLAAQGWTDLPLVYLGAWNVCNVARRRSPAALDDEFSRTGERPDRMRIVDNPFCLDRYRFVGRAELHPTLEAATQSAERHGFAVADSEFLVAARPSASAPQPRSFAEDARVSSIEENGATVALGYSASRAALLVAAVTYDRSWRAEVDGDRIAVMPTAIGQLAVEVPPGTHRLTLRYRDRSVTLGVAISLVATLVALACARLGRRRRPATASPEE